MKSPACIFRLVACALLSALCAHVQAATPRPNIILIMADDFGCECVTANGGQSYQTPHLDRLAATGMRFEQCHVQPLCTPTRVQLMTGRYNMAALTSIEAAARAKLEKALNQFANARPAELDRQFEREMRAQPWTPRRE